MINMLPLSFGKTGIFQQHLMLRALHHTQKPATPVKNIGRHDLAVTALVAPGAAAGRRYIHTAFRSEALKVLALGMRQQKQQHFGALTGSIAPKQQPASRGNICSDAYRSWKLLPWRLSLSSPGASFVLPRCCSFATSAAGRHSSTPSAASSITEDGKLRTSLAKIQQSIPHAEGRTHHQKPTGSSCRMPLADPEGSVVDRFLGVMGVGLLHPQRALKFAATFLLNFRFYFMYMARTTFQAVRPLLAFCVFGEVMKLVLATMSSGLFSFLFSFVLAFEVLYFFLQCYISYTFLTMFFTVLF